MLALALAITATGYYVKQNYQRITAESVVLIMVSVLLLGQHVFAAILLVGSYLLLKGFEFNDMKKKSLKWSGYMIAFFFLFWLIFEIVTGMAAPVAEPISQVIRNALKEQASFPKLYFIGFFRAFPVMSLVTVAGCIMMFQRGTKRSEHSAHFFILSSFLFPLIVTGVIKPDWIEYRLNFHLNPIFVLVYAWTIVQAIVFVREKIASITKSWLQICLSVVTTVVIVAATTEQIHPARFLNVISREYGSEVDHRTAPGSHLRFMPDHKMPGSYVRYNRTDGDIVIVMDWLVQHYYCGDIDYWLRSDYFEEQSYQLKHEYFDVYTSTKIITSAEELDNIVSRPREGRLWIITASPYIESNMHISQEMQHSLRSLNGFIEFYGLDGISAVYCIPPIPE